MRPTESTTLPSEITGAKTMLSAQELELLYTLARDRYTGRGEIVDGGAFLGGSTLALACGLRDNTRVTNKRRRINSYDLFVSDHFVGQFIDGYPEGSSTRPYYDGVIKDVASEVAVHEGDITTFAWTSDNEIEILFIDVAKSWETNDFILHNFFPRLMPGASVIQQDYHWPHTPWISIAMELLADHVTYLGSMPWATAHYRWERALAPGELPARLMDLGAVRLLQLAHRAQVYPRGGREWAAQQCNIVALCLSCGLVDEAAEIYEETAAAAPTWTRDYFKYAPDLPVLA
jgi:predicted O-methyltransferase YrrM